MSAPVAGAAVVSAPVVGVLGLGEAGWEIAAGLAGAGAVVRGFDPRVDGVPAACWRAAATPRRPAGLRSCWR